MATIITTPDAAVLRGNQQHELNVYLSHVSAQIGGLDPLTPAGRVALRLTCASGKTFKPRRLGGSTYKYAMWAAIDPRNGQVLVARTPDDRGRWISAKCRPWNGGDKL